MRAAAAALAAFLALGCGGGAPLLHGAHVLRPGFVEVGAGLSGQAALDADGASATSGQLSDLAVSPGVAPWVSGRVGVVGDNEGGITFTGRSLRLEGRHAFGLGGAALSVGLGGSAIIARQPGHGFDPSSVYGGGVDVPVLLGIRSTGGLYSIWIGPRGGVDVLRGQVGVSDVGLPGEVLADVDATHWFVGGLVGLRAGFRHIHVAVETQFAYHRADGTVGRDRLSLEQLVLTPGGAVLVEF